MGSRIERSEISIKKIILLALLAAFLVFAFLQKDNFTASRAYLDGQRMETGQSVPHAGEIIDLKGSQRVTQEFVAEDKTLNTVTIVFANPQKNDATGKVRVSIEEADGDEVCGVTVKASELNNKDGLIFEFTGNMDALNFSKVLDEYQAEDNGAEKIKLKKGEPYNLVITSKEVDSPDVMGVYTCQPGSEVLAAAVSYIEFLIPVFLVFVIVTLIAAAIIMAPAGRIEEELNRKRQHKGKKAIDLNKLVLRIMFFLTPFVGYAILAKIAGDTMSRTVRHLFGLEGFLNVFIIGLLWWLVYLLCNRTKLTIIITTITVFLFGFANFLLYMFRGSQLTATDMRFITTGLGVAKSYQITFDKAALWAIMITVIWVCLAIGFKGYKGLPLKLRVIPLAIFLAWGAAFYGVFYQSNILQKNVIRVSAFAPDYSYRHYGYALAFTVTAVNLHIEKPEGYDPAAIEKLSAEYKSDKAKDAGKPTETTPNVIAIMNESFADLTALGDVRTNTDPMPFLHSLKENTVHGTMHASVFGARTANSEFEFLTGYTCGFLPFGTMAYNGHVKEGTPNLTTLLDEQSYGGVTAFHPGKRNSYCRDEVYPNLGFKEHIALEDLDDPELLRAYVSDSYDFKVITEEYEKYRESGGKEPYYMFNVTIQNHANYTSAEGVVKAGIELLNDDIRYDNPVNYLNLVKKSDEAFQELVQYFERVNEPTVIVMFGDHQPQFNTSFYSTLLGGSESELSIDVTERKYHVPFVIWANYDIPEEEGVQLSANYLHSYMLKTVGGEMSGFDKYLMDLHEEIPVITSICYMDKKGTVHDLDDDSPYKEKINQYKCVQYNGLVDTDNRVEEFFHLQ